MIPVSRETEARLAEFERAFRKWAPKINLISASTLADFWSRHIEDSLQLLDLAPEARHWVDLGTGGGLPGTVIAAAMEAIPGSRVELVESNRKKTAFLHSVRKSVAPSVVIHSKRIGDVVERIAPPDVVTARAVASLTDLLGWTEKWLSNRTIALFPKGRGYRDEVDDSRLRWDYDLVAHKSAIDGESVILEISRLSRR